MRQPILLVAAGLAALVWGTPALADDFACDGAFSKLKLDNVIVPSGADCTLEKVKVRGNVKVESDGSLVTIRAKIGGNVEADGARFVEILGKTGIRGNVTVKSGGSLLTLGAKIRGNVETDGARFVEILGKTGIRGNLTVKSGGSLLTMGAKIRGNVQTDGASAIQLLEKTSVGGNVQIEKTSGVPEVGVPNEVCGTKIKQDLLLKDNFAPFALGCRNRIKGNLQVESNDIPDFETADGLSVVTAISITENKVRGDLQFKANQGGSGGFEIFDNRIRGNLQCSDNAPAPAGGGNKLRGDAEEQCALLAN